MYTPSLLVLGFTIAVANYYFTAWFIRYAKLRRIADIPTERSSHETPTARGGGVGFTAVSVLAFAAYLVLGNRPLSPGLLAFLLAAVGIACLGWFDDKQDLSAKTRFGVQATAALAVLLLVSSISVFSIPFAGGLQHGLAGFVLGVVWITGVTNIYNFMDGVDGIASVQALGASAGWMIFAHLWGMPELLALNLFIMVAVSVFLIYNWSPAKIFMGDVGSVFLGFTFSSMPFVAVYLSRWGNPAGGVEEGAVIWLAALLLWPFLFDGAYTLFRRFSRGENIFEAHRSHLYQRLNIAGWSHRRISGLYAIFSVVCVGCALGFYHTNDWGRFLILAGVAVASVLYIRFVKRVEEKGLRV